MEFGLNPNIMKEIMDIISKDSNIKSAYLFGSRARGDFKEYSDIDLALYLVDDNIPTTVDVAINEINCIYKFDIVVVRESSSKELVRNIERDGINIFERF